MAKRPLTKLQVCRHLSPYREYLSFQDSDGNTRVMSKKDLSKKYGLKPATITRLKVGSKATLEDKQYTVVQGPLRSMCPYLDESTKACSLPDHKHCTGRRVVGGVASLDEAYKLSHTEIQKDELLRLEEANTSLEAALHMEDELIVNTAQAIDDYIQKYSPLNRFSMSDARSTYDSELEIDDYTGVVYAVTIDEDTGEVDRQRIGVIKADLENTESLSKDYVSLTALYSIIGRALAQTGRVADDIDSYGKQTRAKLRLTSNRLIDDGVIPLNSTNDNVDALVRNSDYYKRIKDLESRATYAKNSLWAYKSSVEQLLKSIGTCLRVATQERQNVQYGS